MIQLKLLLPGMSFSKDAFNRGLGFLSASVPVLDFRVTDTTARMRTFSMAPSKQKSPTVKPSSSAILTVILSLHCCSGRSCLRAEVRATVPCCMGRRVQVTLLKGAGRQDCSWGTNRSTSVFRQSLRSLQSDGMNKKITEIISIKTKSRTLE